MAQRRRLGKTDIEVSPIGLGCWQFSSGKGLVGGYWKALPQETVDAVVAAALRGGITWFDTAEVYGWGHSERALASALTSAGKAPGEVTVATKWWPLGLLARLIKETIADRLRAVSPFGIDLYQVHMPLGLSTVETEMDAMADLVAERKIRAVGVSNFNAGRMRRAHAALAKHGIPLASNQMKYSLLDRSIETNGVLATAKALGVTLIAYSPLEQGLLTGAFHDDPSLIRSRPGPRKWMPDFSERGFARTRPLIDEIKKIAAAHGATASQVALAWVVQFGGGTVVAIPGASRVSHAEESAAANDLVLTPVEVARLDELSRPLSNVKSSRRDCESKGPAPK